MIAEGKYYVSWFGSVLHDMNYRPSFADLDIWVRTFNAR